MIALVSVRLRRVPAVLGLVLVALAAQIAPAQDRGPWTTVGSTGVPDEADAAFIQFGQTGGGFSIEHGTVFLRDNAPAPLQAEMRYNVVAVEELLTGGTDWALAARLRDNGAAAQMFVRLIRVNIRTGEHTELLTLQSDLFPSAAGFRRLTTGRPPCAAPGFELDFVNNAYFVEATLEKTGGNGAPALSAVQVSAVACRS